MQPGMPRGGGRDRRVGFHRAIATATGNEFFEVLLDSIREVLITAQLPTLAEPKIVRGAIEHHAAILEQIEAGDPEGAREAMRAHLADASGDAPCCGSAPCCAAELEPAT